MPVGSGVGMTWMGLSGYSDPERLGRIADWNGNRPIVPPRDPQISEFQLLASICQESFFEFVKEFWETIIAEEPVWNWHIEYLCNRAQTAVEKVLAGQECDEDLVVNVPPGTTKSTIFSVMLPAWVWTRNNTYRIMCASHTYSLGQDLQVKCRDVVQSEKYRNLFPDVEIKEDQNTKGYFALTTGGMRFVATVGGVSPMGFHAHILIVDDPIDPKSALSEADLKAADHWMTNTLPSRKINKVISLVMLIMQRLAQNDPTGQRLKNRKAKPVRHICLPAELTSLVSPPNLVKRYKDGLLDPVRLPRTVLKEAQAGGQYYYAGQFLQNPVPLGGGMFKTKRIKRGFPTPELWLKRVRFWDKAATEGGGAFSVGIKMGVDTTNRLWILDVVREQLDSAEREDLIEDTAVQDSADVTVGVEQEPGSGGKESAENTVRRLMGYHVVIVAPRGNKVIRADSFSSQVNSGNVYLAKGEWNDAYLEELRFFPYSRYKDQVDASSGAFTLINTLEYEIGAL